MLHPGMRSLKKKVNNQTSSYFGSICNRCGERCHLDFSIFPEYQGKGIGKAVLEQIKKHEKKLTAVTRKETLNFFLKAGFVLKKAIKNYYARSVDGYYIIFEEKPRVGRKF